jgi:hypothetical protein
MKTTTALLMLCLISCSLVLAQSPNEKVLAKTGVTLPPDPPKSKQKQKQTPNPTTFGHQAVLTWTAPTTCTDGSPCTAASYNIYKLNSTCPSGTGLTGATKIASVPAPTTTYTDTNITAPGSYCWYVTAVDPNGESTASNASGGNLQQPLLAAPSNFAVAAQ